MTTNLKQVKTKNLLMMKLSLKDIQSMSRKRLSDIILVSKVIRDSSKQASLKFLKDRRVVEPRSKMLQ